MKVVGLCQVRDEADILLETLERNSPLLDAIVAVDNDSGDGTYDILHNNPKVKVLVTDSMPLDNTYYVGLLLTLAENLNADWFVDFDADEIYENPKAIRDMLEDLPDKILCVGMNWQYCLGRNEEEPIKEQRGFRRIYRNIGVYRLIELSRKLKKNHGGRCPIPKTLDNTCYTSYRVFHHQVRSYDQGMRKYWRYVEVIDPELIYQPGGYEHIREMAERLRT